MLIYYSWLVPNYSFLTVLEVPEKWIETGKFGKHENRLFTDCIQSLKKKDFGHWRNSVDSCNRYLLQAIFVEFDTLEKCQIWSDSIVVGFKFYPKRIYSYWLNSVDAQ